MAEETITDDLVIIDEKPARPDLPTQAEVIAAEQGKPAPVVKEEEVKEEVKTEEISQEALAMLQLKLQSGEELTDDEKVIANKIDAEVKDPEPVKEAIFKIGKDEFTSSQLEEKMRTELNLGKLDISSEAKEKMLQMYAKSQNRSEAQVSVAKGFEENARTREMLSMERVKLEQIAKNVAESEQKLESKRAKLLKLANNPIEQKDVYNELNQIDVIKLGEYQKKNSAIEELNEINEELVALKTQKTDTQRGVRVAMANEFMALHPEFKTQGDLIDIATKINQGHEVDPEDEIKVLEVTRLMDEAIARGLTLEKIYSIESRRGTLAVKPTAQSVKEETKIPVNLPKNPKSLAQKIAEYSKKQSKASPGTDSPGTPMPIGKPSTARDLIKSDQATLGLNTSDSFVKLAGY